MDFRLPIPQNWQDFESICHRLWIEIWNDAGAKKNGRQGQPQNGVDIYGRPIYSSLFAGIQCKDKKGQLGSELGKEELEVECEKARKFTPELKAFTLATTAPRDVEIQKHSRLLSDSGSFPFTVDVSAWDDIQSEIVYRPAILQHYYKDFPLIQDERSQIALHRFSPKDQCAAFFSRPGIEQSLNAQLKSYLIAIAYELKDNCFRHGKATEFKIVVEGNKVQFIDNGNEFNILEGVGSARTTWAGNLGSFVINDFLKKFKGHVHASFRWEQKEGKGKNILEFEMAATAGEVLQEDFLEIEIEFPGSREDAARIARSVPITDPIKEVIWNLTSGVGYALSFSSEFIRVLLERMNEHQRLVMYVPRGRMYEELKNLIDDERLVVKVR
jgi:hypothetical protein